MMILSQKYLGVILCLISSLAFGQTNEEIRKRADDFFESEKYIEATKDYLHLLSLTPTDSDLNFKYGTCLLFNSTNKSKAFRYLSYAVKNDEIDPRAFFFNGTVTILLAYIFKGIIKKLFEADMAELKTVCEQEAN